jgi:hypothetical protein
VTSLTGGPLIWSDSAFWALTGDLTLTTLSVPIRLSPDGTLIAVSNGSTSVAGTNIFKNGNFVTTVPGWAVGWIDNSRLLVNTMGTWGLGHPAILGCSIYDSSGVKLTSPPLNLGYFQTVTLDSVYSPSSNEIFSLTTGASTWSSAYQSTGVGAVAGSHVVFASGARVLSEPY